MAVTSKNNLRNGSSGDDVIELQKKLNEVGYTLDVDGNFGSKTEEAVRDYQQKNGLTVDGIVGTNTWGSLTGGNTATTPEQTEPETPAWEYTPYTPSDSVLAAEELLQQQLGNKPGPYSSPWQEQLQGMLDKILNREPFKYDLNGDMLYQQYKDQHTTQGKMAMMDTMGQAAAMTGGYGNSYAQSVGQQAYQGQMQQLNNMIPELYQLALSRYTAEGDSMRDQASILAQMEEQDYGRYRDQVSDYNDELSRLTEDARYKGERDYTEWADDQNFRYQQERDKITDDQWQQQFDEAKRQFDEQMSSSKKKRSSSSNSKKKTVDPDDDTDATESVGYSDIYNDLILAKSQGKDDSWANEYIAAAVEAGYISRTDGMNLYNKYRDNRLK